MQSRCFHGTEEECIKSWIARVEKEMMHLDIIDDGAKADFASQGLSYDAFVFMHMLPDDWRHSWLALKFSLLMRYWRLPKPNDPIESSFLTMFESLQDEFWEMLQSPFDVDAYCDDNAYCLSDLRAESDFESDDYSASLFSADESMDGTPCDGAFVDGESSCDDPATISLFATWEKSNQNVQIKLIVVMKGTKFWSPLIGSLPLSIDVDDCEQNDDASDAYAKYNVLFVDDQIFSHDKEDSDQGSDQLASMHRDLDDEADWGFDLPLVEMDADMTSYVEKASERLRILKSQRETDRACVEFGHVCADMVSWSETDSESKQKGQSNGSMSVPALEAKVNVMLQELPDVCQYQSSLDERSIYEDFCLALIMWDLPTFV
ncbi:hypothetical protein L7F22_013290 [Adiantum nelumboides]|nr:hypothetical protein [Adiantum nelumboides]